MIPKVRSSPIHLLALLLLGSSLFARQALATLGEKEDSVERDRKAFGAALGASIAHENYTVHEFSSGGLTLREYASASGAIFGLAWKGITHPDLSSVLGVYFADYQKASKAAAKAKGHRPHSLVQGSNVIVEKFGHMRAVQGKAYVPVLLPEGVSPREIQ